MSGPEGDQSLALAEALAGALRSRGVPEPDLVVAAPPIVTARSTLHRYTDRSTGRAYVVKRPLLAEAWLDTEAALPTAAQFEALERAYRWQAEEDRHAVVEPVALLSEHDAFAMAWVGGRTVKQAIRRALVDPATARGAVGGAGEFLRAFHRHAHTADIEVGLRGPAAEVLDLGAGAAREAGVELPRSVVAMLQRLPERSVTSSQVLLHGDFVPSNLLLRTSGEVVMIDPLLARTGSAAEDLARFLTVMSSESVFVPGLALPRVRRVRRSLEGAFRAGYGLRSDPALLELHLMKQHLLRWVVRREHFRPWARQGLLAARNSIIDRHMRTMVLESAARLERALGGPSTWRTGPASAAVPGQTV